MELLKNKPEGAVADIRELIVIEMFDCCAIEPIASKAWAIEASQNVHRCAFPGATGSHHGQIIALTDGEIELVECSDAELSLPVDLADSNQFGNRCRSGVSQGHVGKQLRWLPAAGGWY